ncbi:MAG: acyl-CoA dehydrogenase family protein [Pseudomonadota bacterium]
MVDFSPTEEQELIQRTARDFAMRELAPGAAKRDRECIYPVPELRKLGEVGLLGVNIPAEYGGAEAGCVAYVLAMIELAKVCPSTCVIVTVTNMVAEIVNRFGTEAQRRKYVTKITSGDAIAGAFALSEPQCGSDAASIKTTAKHTADGWVLNGTKQWITSGDHAEVIVVWARTGEEPGAKGISAFVVEQRTPGLIIGKHEDKLGVRGSTTVPLVFEDCLIPEDALLGEEGGGFLISMAALDGGRIGIASQALGIGFAALEHAIGYAKERKTFGKAIAKHQAIQWMFADSATELEAARLLTLRSASLKEQGKPYTKEASMAKVYASETANRVCYRALQIHGGYGYTKDYPVERLTRDARATTIYEGTSEIQRIVIARSLLRDS